MYASILSLPPDELYQKAIVFKELSDYNNYIVHMTMAANLDHQLAIENLCNDYINEHVHEKQDYSRTMNFYETSFEYAFSANYLGWMFSKGLGVTQDYNKAIELYQMAIEKENSFAMINLASIYKNGNGLSRNYNKTIELYEMANKKGNSVAITNLARMYEDGIGVSQDYYKAIELYQIAIEKGHSSGMNNLALLYEKGMGVSKDYDKAIKLYKLAISKGNSSAMYNLADMYETELDARDYDQMKKYYLMAINKGHQNATTDLKNYYERTQTDISIIELYDNKYFHDTAKNIINTTFQKNHSLPKQYKQCFANLRFDSDIRVTVQTKQYILKITNIWPSNYDDKYLPEFEELLLISSSDKKPFCKDIILHIAGCLFI